MMLDVAVAVRNLLRIGCSAHANAWTRPRIADPAAAPAIVARDQTKYPIARGRVGAARARAAVALSTRPVELGANP